MDKLNKFQKLQKSVIQRCLKRHGGNMAQTAEYLGIVESTLVNRAIELGLIARKHKVGEYIVYINPKSLVTNKDLSHLSVMDAARYRLMQSALAQSNGKLSVAAKASGVCSLTFRKHAKRLGLWPWTNGKPKK